MTEHVGDQQGGQLGAIFDWIVALRDGDVATLVELLEPDVVWHGLDDGALCLGRGAVIDALREQIPLCLDVEALELISAPNSVVVGTRSTHLPQPPNTQLEGQIYNVFERRGRRYAAIHDFVHRDDALQWAGAREPAWR